ncbi:hypothetical protein MAFF212519_06020 [Clavibacter michiganensis]
MPTQMPSTGRPPARRRSTTRSPPAARSAVITAENARPGDEEAVGLVRPLRVARQLDIGAGQLERLDGGVDVAAPVVEDDDGGPRHSAPFVDGMPDTRGSSSFA